jgi:DNA repair protein RadC
MNRYGKTGPSSEGAFQAGEEPARSAGSFMRPRERMRERGPASLSDAELVQAIIGAGGKGNSVAALSAKVVEALDALSDPAEPSALEVIRGIGRARACSIAAAMELGRRRYRPGDPRIAGPQDIFRQVSHFADRKQERFIAATLNGAHEVIAVRVVSIGLVNRTLIHPREVFSDAVQDRAAAIVVAHNHPTGRLEPSREDMDVTVRLVQAGRTIGIPLLDHLVFSGEGFYSFREGDPALFAEE